MPDDPTASSPPQPTAATTKTRLELLDETRLELLNEKAALEPVDVNGRRFWLRPPTISDRKRLHDSAGLRIVPGKKPKVGQIDLARLQVEATILMVHTEAGQPVFRIEDRERIATAHTGGTIDQLGQLCLEMLERGRDEGKD